MLVQLNFEWWVEVQHTEKTDENTLKAERAMLADALEGMLCYLDWMQKAYVCMWLDLCRGSNPVAIERWVCISC